MTLPWMFTDVLLEVLQFAGPLSTVAALMQLSKLIHSTLKHDMTLWRALCNMESCPLCMLEFADVQSLHATTDHEYWFRACKMVVATKSLRRQWRMNTSARCFRDADARTVPRPGPPQRMPPLPAGPHHDAPSTAPLSTPPSAVWTVPTRLIKKTVDKILHSKKSKLYEDVCESIVVEPRLQLVPFEEVRELLRRYLQLEGGVLFDEHSNQRHLHDIGMAGRYHRIFDKKKIVGFSPRLPDLRHAPWKEVSVVPAANPRGLAVLYSFIGCNNGRKTDLRLLTRSMYDAAGGGAPMASPVRWFYTKLASGPHDNRDLLVVICFSHDADESSPSRLCYKPNSVRIVGVSCLSSTSRLGSNYGHNDDEEPHHDGVFPPPTTGGGLRDGGFQLRRR